MNKDFLSWLGQTEKNTCMIQSAGMTYYFVRIAKSEAFDYLYCQKKYSGKELARGGTFEYAGIFCRSDGELYDGQQNLRDLAGEDTEERSARQLRENLQCNVCQLVESAIGNDRRNLQITELSNPELLRRLQNEQNYYAKNTAREHFLDTVDFEPPTFRCLYDAKNWTEDSLLSYILDPQGYSAKEATVYMAEHQEEMLFYFLCNDAELAEYQAFVADTDNPVHIVKKIMAAMNHTSAKTVNITINKDGEEFTFKTEARELRRDCTDHYHVWNIVATDRRKFKERFGKNTEYYPKEIVRITYAKTVLYEREETRALTYECDLCGERKNLDEEIIWLTSSFGVCGSCYEKLSEEEKERLILEHE